MADYTLNNLLSQRANLIAQGSSLSEQGRRDLTEINRKLRTRYNYSYQDAPNIVLASGDIKSRKSIGGFETQAHYNPNLGIDQKPETNQIISQNGYEYQYDAQGGFNTIKRPQAQQKELNRQINLNLRVNRGEELRAQDLASPESGYRQIDLTSRGVQSVVQISAQKQFNKETAERNAWLQGPNKQSIIFKPQQKQELIQDLASRGLTYTKPKPTNKYLEFGKGFASGLGLTDMYNIQKLRFDKRAYSTNQTQYKEWEKDFLGANKNLRTQAAIFTLAPQNAVTQGIFTGIAGYQGYKSYKDFKKTGSYFSLGESAASFGFAGLGARASAKEFLSKSKSYNYVFEKPQVDILKSRSILFENPEVAGLTRKVTTSTIKSGKNKYTGVTVTTTKPDYDGTLLVEQITQIKGKNGKIVGLQKGIGTSILEQDKSLTQISFIVKTNKQLLQGKNTIFTNEVTDGIFSQTGYGGLRKVESFKKTILKPSDVNTLKISKTENKLKTNSFFYGFESVIAERPTTIKQSLSSGIFIEKEVPSKYIRGNLKTYSGEKITRFNKKSGFTYDTLIKPQFGDFGIKNVPLTNNKQTSTIASLRLTSQVSAAPIQKQIVSEIAPRTRLKVEAPVKATKQMPIFSNIASVKTQQNQTVSSQFKTSLFSASKLSFKSTSKLVNRQISSLSFGLEQKQNSRQANMFSFRSGTKQNQQQRTVVVPSFKMQQRSITQPVLKFETKFSPMAFSPPRLSVRAPLFKPRFSISTPKVFKQRQIKTKRTQKQYTPSIAALFQNRNIYKLGKQRQSKGLSVTSGLGVRL